MTDHDHLVADLITYLQANNIRHLSIFIAGGEPRIYVSAHPYGGPETRGSTLDEAMAALKVAIDERNILETMY